MGFTSHLWIILGTHILVFILFSCVTYSSTRSSIFIFLSWHKWFTQHTWHHYSCSSWCGQLLFLWCKRHEKPYKNAYHSIPQPKMTSLSNVLFASNSPKLKYIQFTKKSKNSRNLKAKVTWFNDCRHIFLEVINPLIIVESYKHITVSQTDRTICFSAVKVYSSW